MTFSRIKLLDVPMTRASLEALVVQAIEGIAEGRQSVFSCANPHSIIEARQSPVFLEALNDADQIVADGTGAAIAAHLCGWKDVPRITGSDYFAALMRALNERGSGRVAFFGSSEKVLELIRERFEKEYPNLELVAMVSPPFGEWSEEKNSEMIASLNLAKPDVLWVGMTAPKQECWTYRNRKKIDAKVIGNIGAVFDFYAGTKPRAPQWACQLGIEWAHRLFAEPRRLWRRNLVSTPLFLWLFGTRFIVGQAAHEEK